MAKRERFGKFVLLEDLEPSSLGAEDRAAKLGPAGLEKIVSILRLTPALGSNADAAKSLMDQVKVAAQLQNPNIVRIYGIGKVDAVYYVSYEFVEGQSLRAIFERCRRDSFPFSVDHALLIASKICSALEYSHGRKTESGARYCHGLLNPGNVLVSYEGEVRVRGFGHWLARVREAGVLRDQDLLYLSPEQAGGGPADTSSDIFAVGGLLFETLTGRPLFEGGRADDIPARLAAARLQNPSGDDDTVPKPIAEILARSLAQEPSGRYREIQELRKGIDTLLFSGDYTPTTFNIAFFMHSIFREDIDRESRQIKEEREASYAEFLVDGGPKPTGNTVTLNTTPVPSAAAPPRPRVEPSPDVVQEGAPATRDVPASTPSAPFEPPHASPGVSAKDAAASFTFHKDAAPKRKTPLLAAALLGIVVVGAAAYYFLGPAMGGGIPSPSPPAPSTLSSEATAALARVKELEEKLKAIEDEKAAAEQQAKEDAAAKLQKRSQGQRHRGRRSGSPEGPGRGRQEGQGGAGAEGPGGTEEARGRQGGGGATPRRGAAPGGGAEEGRRGSPRCGRARHDHDPAPYDDPSGRPRRRPRRRDRRGRHRSGPREGTSGAVSPSRLAAACRGRRGAERPRG